MDTRRAIFKNSNFNSLAPLKLTSFDLEDIIIAINLTITFTITVFITISITRQLQRTISIPNTITFTMMTTIILDLFYHSLSVILRMLLL